MLIKRLAAAVLAVGVVSSGTVMAQSSHSSIGMPSRSKQKKSLADQLGGLGDGLGRTVDNIGRRVDDIGRTVLGKILPGGKEDRESSTAETAVAQSRQQHGQVRSTSARAGSILNASSRMDTRPKIKMPTRSKMVVYSKKSYSEKSAGSMTVAPRRSSQTAGTTNSAARSTVVSGSSSSGSAPIIRPLHERLAAFRQSAFATDNREVQKAASRRPTAATERSAEVFQRSKQPSTVQRPTPAVRSKKAVDTADTVAPQKTVEATAETASPQKTDKPTPAAKPTRAIEPITAALNPMRNAASAVKPKPPAVQGKKSLFTANGPMLGIETTGPRQIAVGKESKYAVTIQNSGRAAADEVVVLVDLPDWAEVLGTQTSTGATELIDQGRDARLLQWSVGNLPAKVSQHMTLRIVPRESRPFDLAVRYQYKPTASHVSIEVQEPKLAIALEGPRDVLYGEKGTYKLNLANTGNGCAENVIVRLVQIGGVGNRPISRNLGDIAAGGEKSVEVELTAGQVGEMTIRVDVRGDGGVHADLSERVVVRRADLQVEAAGPKVQYVGAVATYSFCVRNPGTAPAENVRLSVNLPAGMKYISGIETNRLKTDGNNLQWTIDRLEPGNENNFEIKCSLGLPGAVHVDMVATADGELNAAAGATTRVEAIADLVLDVQDPTGPVPVGGEAVYELHIRNRGSKAASEVQVFVYFSRGVEPTSADGARHRIAPGQVVFSPITSVAAGGERVLKIRAKAEADGNHIFRAEVHCKPLGTRLVSEETTHFYR